MPGDALRVSETETPSAAAIEAEQSSLVRSDAEAQRPTPDTRTQAGAPKVEAHTLRVATDKVDKLINLVGELVINQSMLNEVIQDFSMPKLPRCGKRWRKWNGPPANFRNA